MNKKEKAKNGTSSCSDNSGTQSAVNLPAPTSPAVRPGNNQLQQTTKLPGPTSLELARQLIPNAVRDRKFRADSFLSQLTPEHRNQLVEWLAHNPITEVHRRVALPPPQGFGMQVCYTSLWRLKNFVDNHQLTTWVADAMDAACDTLHSDSAADAAPLRETISLLLHSHVIQQLRAEAPVDDINKTLGAIAKIEKLRAAANPHPRGPSQKLKLDVTVSAARRAGPDAPAPIEVRISPDEEQASQQVNEP